MWPLIIPTLEICILAFIINYLLSFFWNTRTMDLVFGFVIGLAAITAFYFASRWFQLPVLHKLIVYFINVAVMALLIIFQPELRLAISRLNVKGKKYQEITEFDKFLDSLAHSIYRMAEKRVGAIVVLENQDTLEEYVNKAVSLDAHFSPELLETIFTTTTPLHDGAVIVRGTTILSAATILPLADDSSQLSKSMGTRHRAGLGISQISDALVIVVSEETGKVSIARDGIITRGVKLDRFKGIVRSIFTPPQTKLPSGMDMFSKLKALTSGHSR